MSYIIIALLLNRINRINIIFLNKYSFYLIKVKIFFTYHRVTFKTFNVSKYWNLRRTLILIATFFGVSIYSKLTKNNNGTKNFLRSWGSKLIKKMFNMLWKFITYYLIRRKKKIVPNWRFRYPAYIPLTLWSSLIIYSHLSIFLVSDIFHSVFLLILYLNVFFFCFAWWKCHPYDFPSKNFCY